MGKELEQRRGECVGGKRGIFSASAEQTKGFRDEAREARQVMGVGLLHRRHTDGEEAHLGEAFEERTSTETWVFWERRFLLSMSRILLNPHWFNFSTRLVKALFVLDVALGAGAMGT